MRLHNKIQVLNLLNHHIGVYPTPMNLNWNWSWGSLSGLVLASQIVTGILLAMHYVGHVDHAFASVQHLMVDVPSGMILRYTHANGASLFFTVVYLHVLRGLYYSSGNQPREILWISGVIILLLMIITAFIGYVLPWGYSIGPKCLEVMQIATKNLFSLDKLQSLAVWLVQIYTKIFLFFIEIKAILNSNLTLTHFMVLHSEKNTELVALCMGLLLGDAYAEKRSNNARLVIKQSCVHEPWFFYLHSFFSKHGLCNPVLPKKTPSTDKKTGVTTYSYKFNTYSSLLFVAMHSLFYHSIDGKFKKRLHKELIHFLTPLSIAAWVCDDGYDNNGSTAFCTDSFSDECLDILIEIF